MSEDSEEISILPTLVSSTVSDDIFGLNLNGKRARNHNEADETKPLNGNDKYESDDDILNIDCSKEYAEFIENKLTPISPISLNSPISSQASSVSDSRKRRYEDETVIRRSPQLSKKQKRKMKRISQSVSEIQPIYLDQNANYTHSAPVTKSKPNPINSKDIENDQNRFAEAEKISLTSVFRNLCQKNLFRKCRGICSSSHELPDLKYIKERLSEMDAEDVRDLFYAEIEKNDRLLTKYFATFCEYFGTKKLKSDLIDMIPICTDPKRSKAPSLMHHVFDALVTTGMSYSEALVRLLKSQKIINSKVITVLITLIVHKRNDEVTKFRTDLEMFCQQLKESKMPLNSLFVDRFLEIGLKETRDINWYNFVTEIVHNYSNLSRLDQNLLIAFKKLSPKRNPSSQQ